MCIRDRFYKLLHYININFVAKVVNVPEWFLQYTEEEPPLYWKTVYEILRYEDRNQSIVEIGAGYGDITALLYFMGFRNIISFEYDSNLIFPIEDKIKFLFGIKPNIVNNTYPQKLSFKPVILIQVNCVYPINITKKAEYLKQIRNFYEFNGEPVLYVFEYIDEIYSLENEVFPKFIRLNNADISRLFPDCRIESYYTYKFPINKTTKKICSIKILENV